ncbi:hypothetical protein SNOG_00059 [Parastagonospora nodorum SN15]|uniref:Uncharacterized protein n=1 Tax=Phaeosphaeria nodorum (strain SN15 / ATCC MYA-4574 / FGSC 10173) TaxID=321614 RepID=Q0V7F5_PHANO|nr:hypothetical protein SNOG_00059 [Parastagonospora nodorum SN15]EAT91554.1 hypothetical protein SNOG_00059 [Parastagonospora nodorum SN15]
MAPRSRVAEPPPHTASDEAGYIRTLKFGGQQMYPRAMEPAETILRTSFALRDVCGTNKLTDMG